MFYWKLLYNCSINRCFYWTMIWILKCAVYDVEIWSYTVQSLLWPKLFVQNECAHTRKIMLQSFACKVTSEVFAELFQLPKKLYIFDCVPLLVKQFQFIKKLYLHVYYCLLSCFLEFAEIYINVSDWSSIVLSFFQITKV